MILGISAEFGLNVMFRYPGGRAYGGPLLARSTGLSRAGGASLMIVMALVLLWHGDRELDAADLLLSELHLGATYHAIVRRRLWRRMPLDVVAMPLAIVVATYASCGTAGRLLVTTAVLWHPACVGAGRCGRRGGE